MSDLLDRARAHVGKPAAPLVSRDPVNLPMVRHWCDAMGDDNPVYTDAEFASRSLHGGLVAPPAMLDVWDKAGLKFVRDPDSPQGAVLNELDALGFVSTVAVNSEHEYARYLRPGELVRSSQVVDDVSDEKATALGVGHFVTVRYEFSVEGGEVVGTMLFRVLKFRPGTGRGSGPGTAGLAAPNDRPGEPPERPGPARREVTLRRSDVADGDAMPELAVYLTPTLIVSGAIATRDFERVHHDRDLARERGSKDLFMNILTGMGLTQRWISDWAGPEAVFRNIRLRLGVPNYPYDTMTFAGSVAAITGDTVTLSFRGTNSLGDHLTGSAALVLPD